MKKNLVAKNELGIYADADGVVRADSLVVAQIFEKRHDNVVRDIRNLDCSEEFRLLNFEESSYINRQGHRQACYNMTRDGFVFLVMGYRGKKAASFKEAYIKRLSYMWARRNLLRERNLRSSFRTTLRYSASPTNVMIPRFVGYQKNEITLHLSPGWCII